MTLAPLTGWGMSVENALLRGLEARAESCPPGPAVLASPRPGDPPEGRNLHQMLPPSTWTMPASVTMERARREKRIGTSQGEGRGR